MTLVIAGHTYEEDLKFSWTSKKEKSEPPSMHPSGLFVAADSVLTVHGTTGTQPILDNFRKVYSIPIKVWKPYFLDDHFHSYQQIHFESACFVAFSGSSLVAQHALNAITSHLGELRITRNSAHKYVVIRDCEKNDLISTQHNKRWDEDTFLPKHFDSILSANDLAKHVEHSINVALRSAKKYKGSTSSVEAMRTDFAFGVQCPTTQNYELYVFRMTYEFTENGLVVKTAAEQIHPGNVVVLGMRRRFEQGAQHTFSTALKSGDSPEKSIFDFLNVAIDQVSADGSFEIARPSSLKKLENRKLSLVSHKKD